MIRFPELESLGVSVAGMTEAADGDFRSNGDSLRQVAPELRNRNVIRLKQVHGTRVWPVDEAGLASASGGEGDGLITNERDVALAVSVADCIPVLLFDAHKQAVGAVHAGRVGTYHNIAASAVQMMQLKYNSIPSDLHAVIGPGAGRCCYEVSEQIAGEFTVEGLPAFGRYLDLPHANAEQLEALGVPGGQIHPYDMCTICDTRFHSHRRTGDGARNVAVIAL